MPFLGLLLIQLLQGALPAAVIALTALAVNGSLAAMGSLVAVFGVLLFVRDTVDTLVILLLTESRDRVAFRARRDLLAGTLKWTTVEPFEDPEIVTARVAAALGTERSPRAVMVLSNFAGAIFGIVPLFVIGGGLSLLLPILVFLGLLPLTIYSIRLEDRVWSAEADHADDLVAIMNLEEIGETAAFAREVRNLRAGSWILGRWTSRRGEIVRSIRRLRVRGGLMTLLLTIVSVGFSLAGFTVAARGAVALPSVLVVTIGVVIQLREQMYAIVANIGDMRSVLPPFGALVRFAHLDGAGASEPAGGGRAAPPETGEGIVLRDCYFAYPSAEGDILRGVSFSVPQGRNVAIVGPNGGGKSTIVNAMSGLYPRSAVRGDVLVAEPPVIMFQSFARFPLTVRENLQVGRDFSESAMWDALELVELGAFVRGLEDGLDTRLYLDAESGGVNLSGGQWQRLALARAVLHSAGSKILVLDEITSALDPDSESRIFARLHSEVFPSRTVVHVTHRLDQAAQADEILLVEDGRVTRSGTPSEMYSSSGWFRDAFDAQARGFRAFG